MRTTPQPWAAILCLNGEHIDSDGIIWPHLPASLEALEQAARRRGREAAHFGSGPLPEPEWRAAVEEAAAGLERAPVAAAAAARERAAGLAGAVAASGRELAEAAAAVQVRPGHAVHPTPLHPPPAPPPPRPTKATSALASALA
jgi:hypothetical protein